MTALLSFNDVLNETAGGEGRHILLGAGFSAGASQAMTDAGLVRAMMASPGFDTVRHLFEREGTYDVEQVMGNIVHRARVTGQPNKADEEWKALRGFFAKAIASSQWAGIDGNDGELMSQAGAFLAQFDSAFSLNFDQLAYQAFLRANDDGLCRFTDGFNSESPGDTEKVYKGFWSTQRKHLRFPHGTLYIREAQGKKSEKLTTRSTKFVPAPLLEQLGHPVEMRLRSICLFGFEQIRPLVVVAGTTEEKMKQICESEFLRDAFTALQRIRGALITYGWSMSEPDRHLVNAIAQNPGTRNVYVGIHGDCRTRENQKTINEALMMIFGRVPGADRQDIKFFSTDSAGVWRAPDLRFVGQSTVSSG